MPTLAIDDISKRFRDSHGRHVVALNNCSLRLNDNELLVLVGPSGCGKTTLLRVVAGLETPDNGEVLLGSETITKKPAKVRNVAMVFQSAALLPHLTVFENLALGLKLRKVGGDEIKTRVAECADVLRIFDKLNRKPQELSGGEAQRVSLGRALLRQPNILLLDEPLSNLDPISRKHLRGEILCLQQRLQVPALFVTHDRYEALNLGRRIAVMNGGAVQQVGMADDLIRNPANEFVREFLSC